MSTPALDIPDWMLKAPEPLVQEVVPGDPITQQSKIKIKKSFEWMVQCRYYAPFIIEAFLTILFITFSILCVVTLAQQQSENMVLGIVLFMLFTFFVLVGSSCYYRRPIWRKT
jgi:glycerol uptake facilitator-like aquaporin